MRTPRPTGLRARLLLGTFIVSLLAVGAMVLAFNVILDARLEGEVGSLLRDRAAALEGQHHDHPPAGSH